MLNFPFAFALLLGVHVVLASPLLGQSGDQGEERPTVEAIFSTLSWKGVKYFYYSSLLRPSEIEEREEQGETIDYNLESQPYITGHYLINKDVVVTQNARSRRQAYHGPPVVHFYPSPPKTTIETDEEGNPRWVTTPDPVARVTLPSGGGEFLLIFYDLPPEQQAERGVKYLVQAVSDDVQTLPEGSYRFINLTDANFRGFMEETRFNLGRYSTQIIRPAIESARSFAVRLFNAEESLRDKPVYSARWYHNPQQRAVVFVRRSFFVTDGFEMKIIEERLGARERPPE